MNTFKIAGLLFFFSSNIFANSVIEKVMQMKEPVAKSVIIDMEANLENNDFGAYKEFLINLDQITLLNYKVLKRAKGHFLSQSVLSPINHQHVHVLIKELDEYYGMSIDGVVAIPFNAINGDDDYLNTYIEDGGQAIAEYESDTIDVYSLEKEDLNGEQLLTQMRSLIKGCKMNQEINLFFSQSDEERANCRNFVAALTSLSAMGLSHDELRELIHTIDSKALDHRVELSIAGIDWWIRNFER